MILDSRPPVPEHGTPEQLADYVNEHMQTVVGAARQAGILVPDAEQVDDYLRKFPRMSAYLVGVMPLAQRELGKGAQLSLEMFFSMESENDEFLTLMVRMAPYPKHVMSNIHAFTEKYLWPLPDYDGWFHVSTDFQKPKGL